MKLIATAIMLLALAELTFAKMVQTELTPATIESYKWAVVTTENQNATTFTISVIMGSDSLPAWTSAALEVFHGNKLIARSELRFNFEKGKASCQFTVSNDYLAGSRFTLTKIDHPHPSGDIYWISLDKFKKSTIKHN